MSASPLASVEEISKAYRTPSGELPVLRGVSFALPRGGTTSLVGVSGSGKSTLISVLAGLMLPDAGSVVFDGQEITGLTERGRAQLRARRIGIVLQSGNLIPFLSARENVELALELAGSERAGERTDALLGDLGLSGRGDHLPRRLSGGEAQRVALAMALANEPELLLADEVAGELDSSTADRVMRLIFDTSQQRGLTVLMVTHSRELAARTDHQLQLVDGTVRPA